MTQICIFIAIISFSMTVFVVMVYSKKSRKLEDEKDCLRKERENLEADIESFKKERNIRNSLSAMSDRQIAEDTYIKISKILKENQTGFVKIENSLKAIKDDLNYKLNDVKSALDSGCIYDTHNKSSLDSDDVTSAIENAFSDYNISWKMESIVESALVKAGLDQVISKLDEIQWKLNQ